MARLEDVLASTCEVVGIWVRAGDERLVRCAVRQVKILCAAVCL